MPASVSGMDFESETKRFGNPKSILFKFILL